MVTTPVALRRLASLACRTVVPRRCSSALLVTPMSLRCCSTGSAAAPSSWGVLPCRQPRPGDHWHCGISAPAKRPGHSACAVRSRVPSALPATEQRCRYSCRAGSNAGASAESADSSSAGAGMQQSSGVVLTLPTMLTLARVAAIPALIAAWFAGGPSGSAWVTGIFLAASLTDWLDGYLARKLNASSAFGAFLDPVADKLMVATVLVLLSTQPLAAGPLAGNAWAVPVATLVIIGREITMSALREWAATLGPAAQAAVAVNAWGKWKTATQMAALTCLLLTRDGAVGPLGEVAAVAGLPLLGAASYLTAHSLAVYLGGLWRYMK